MMRKLLTLFTLAVFVLFASLTTAQATVDQKMVTDQQAIAVVSTQDQLTITPAIQQQNFYIDSVAAIEPVEAFVDIGIQKIETYTNIAAEHLNSADTPQTTIIAFEVTNSVPGIIQVGSFENDTTLQPSTADTVQNTITASEVTNSVPVDIQVGFDAYWLKTTQLVANITTMQTLGAGEPTAEFAIDITTAAEITLSYAQQSIPIAKMIAVAEPVEFSKYTDAPGFQLE